MSGSESERGRPAAASATRAGLGLDLSVDPDSTMPPFEQLRTRIRDAVTSGELAAGARLPTVRALAEAIGVAANTVARSYRELEADGLIETRGRAGSFVSATGSPTRQELQKAARWYADRTRALGVDPVEALELVAAALGRR